MSLELIGKRFKAIDERLKRIEKKLNLSEAGLANADHSSTPHPKEELTSVSLESEQSFNAKQFSNENKANINSKQTRPLEQSFMLGNWLGAVAVICFILAAGFIIKLSIDSGWLTPARQIAIAALLGLSLISAGLLLMKKNLMYASYLPATGIVILYLSNFAANQFYNLIESNSALGIAILISILCLWLYVKFKNDIYALTAVIGAYIAPIILFSPVATENFITENFIFAIYYFLYCSFTFAFLSIFLKSRFTSIIACYLAIVINSLIGLNFNKTGLDYNLLIALVLAIHFLIFSISVYVYTWYNHQPLTEKESWSFFPVLMLFYAMEFYFIGLINPQTPQLPAWCALIFSGVILGLYFSAQKWFPRGHIKSRDMLLSFISIVLFHSVYLQLLPEILKPWLLVLIVLFACNKKWKIKQKWEQDARTIAIPTLLIGIILLIEYYDIIEHLLTNYQLWTSYHLRWGWGWVLVGFAAFLSLGFLFMQRRNELIYSGDYGYLYLALTHILAVSLLYCLSESIGSFAVSATWLFYALGIMAYAFYLRDKILAKSALFILGLSAIKALFFDVAATPTPVRILCLLLTGIVLYTVGYLIKRIEKW